MNIRDLEDVPGRSTDTLEILTERYLQKRNADTAFYQFISDSHDDIIIPCLDTPTPKRIRIDQDIDIGQNQPPIPTITLRKGNGRTRSSNVWHIVHRANSAAKITPEVLLSSKPKSLPKPKAQIKSNANSKRKLSVAEGPADTIQTIGLQPHKRRRVTNIGRHSRGRAIARRAKPIAPINLPPKILWRNKKKSAFHYNKQIDYQKATDLGKMTFECGFCHAMRWKFETESMCCKLGRT